MSKNITVLIIYLIYLFFISLTAFFLYWNDKLRAKKNKWRIRESTLLCFGAFGGAAGALLAMKLFRHKTKHWYFWAVNILGLIWQLGLPIIYLFFFSAPT